MARDLLDLGEAVALHQYEFTLSPALWAGNNPYSQLQWECVLFSEANAEQVPTTSGVYAFCVRPEIGGNLCGAYLMYVGMTERPLRVRYREYVGDIDNPKARPKIGRMLRQFHRTGHLYFCFATIEGEPPADVEASLLSALVPPVNDRLPADIGRAIAAFR